MKALKQGLLLLATVCFLAQVQAQTADEIVNKHIEAIGGKDKMAQLKSIHMDMTMQVMGNEAPSSVTIVEGKGYKSEADIMGQKMVQVFTDKGGWVTNPMMGSSAPVDIPAEQYGQVADQIYATGQLYNYAAKGNKIELQGQEKIGDVNAYKLQVTTSHGSETTYYIDPATYYNIRIVKTGEMMGNSTTITVDNSNFEKTPEGYVFPRTVQTDMGGQFSLSARVDKVDINPAVDATIFDKPVQ
jgi:hypothetical protein